MMIVKTGKPQPRKVFYICNRQRCENCAEECHHTTDEAYALFEEHGYFELASDGSIWEVYDEGVR